MFNGHMDTSNTGREEFLTGIGYKANAVIKNGMIYGLGIYNMKGALVCYTQAVKALQRAGVKLEGDVIIAAVAGEIEKTQWGDEFRGKRISRLWRGHALLVNHGVAARHVHSGRAHRHADHSWTLRLALGAHFASRACMCTPRSRSRRAERQLHPPPADVLGRDL